MQAQSYLITFAGTGASTTVDSVKVENLSQCTSLALTGTDTLLLSSTTGINDAAYSQDVPVNIYPNPSPGDCSVKFKTKSAGDVSIGLYDITGKAILQQKEFSSGGDCLFHLTGIRCGAYILKIVSDDHLYTSKLISQYTGMSSPDIESPASDIGRHYNLSHAEGMYETVGAGSIIYMQFNAGDTLKLTGKAGVYKTVSMLFPVQDQAVTFPFTDCADIDGNHYAVVRIGSQLWMQENLKATHYQDGSDIPNVPDSATWGALATGAWCDFRNLPAEGAAYGHLYNFYAVNDIRKICPAGWHVPSNSEWNTLEEFLDTTVDTTALGGTGRFIGRILKEGCTTRWQYMDSTYGFNSAGFTALCANFRNATGAWSLAPGDNHDDGFWTSTSYSTNSAWYRSLRWCYPDIYCMFPMKKSGNSVRCIKDN